MYMSRLLGKAYVSVENNQWNFELLPFCEALHILISIILID